MQRPRARHAGAVSRVMVAHRCVLRLVHETDDLVPGDGLLSCRGVSVAVASLLVWSSGVDHAERLPVIRRRVTTRHARCTPVSHGVGSLVSITRRPTGTVSPWTVFELRPSHAWMT